MPGEKTWRDFVLPALEAVKKLGLDPKPVDFREVPQSELNRLVGLGLPWAPPHWTRGRESLRVEGEWRQAGSRALEVVWDMGDVAVAYISSAQGQGTATLTVPHVYGHSHVFRHNAHQAARSGDLWSYFASGAERIREYEATYGPEEVEMWLDLAMAFAPQVTDAPPPQPYKDEERPPKYQEKISRKEYVKTYRERRLEWMEAERRAMSGDGEIDVLRWIIQHAPIEEWQRDVLSIEREVALYWKSRNLTKYVHEGLATFAHSHALPMMGIPHEWILEISRAHSMTTYPRLSNPYWFGWKGMEYVWSRKGVDALLERVAIWADSSMFYELSQDEGFVHFIFDELVEAYGEEALRAHLDEEGVVSPNLRAGFCAWLSEYLQNISLRLVEHPPTVRVRTGHLALGEISSLKAVAEVQGDRDMSISLISEEPLDQRYAYRVAEIFAETTGIGITIYEPRT